MTAAKRSVRLIISDQDYFDQPLQDAVARLREMGHPVDARICAEAGDAEILAAEAADTGIDVVVAVGGDGTVHEVVNGVMRVSPGECGAAVVPRGTANDFAAQLNIGADDPAAALMLVADAEPLLIDLGRMSGRFFINVAAGGYGAEVTTETNATLKQFMGKFAYIITGVAKAVGLSKRLIRVESPARHWEGDAYMIFVGNGAQTGGGFKVLPSASMNDGLLDVMIIPEMPFQSMMDLFQHIMRTSKPNEEAVVYFQTPELDVYVRETLQMNLDGEPYTGAGFHFEVVPNALPFYMPAGVPAASPT